MKKLFTLAFAMLCLFANAQNKTHKFELKGKEFLLDGKPFQLLVENCTPPAFLRSIGATAFKWQRQWAVTPSLLTFFGMLTNKRPINLTLPRVI